MGGILAVPQQRHKPFGDLGPGGCHSGAAWLRAGQWCHL